MPTIADIFREEFSKETILRFRKSVLMILEARFGHVPEPIEDTLEQVYDLDLLQDATLQAAICDTLPSFIQWLNSQATTP